MKENECKEKRRYGWYASKEKNTNVARGVAREPGYDGVHHHPQPHHLVNDVRHGLGHRHRRAPPPRDE